MAGDVNSSNSIADTASNGTPRYASEKVGGRIVASITIKDITKQNKLLELVLGIIIINFLIVRLLPTGKAKIIF